MEALAEAGVSMSQVIGFVHNHPAWMYGGYGSAPEINRYPSVNDWNAADWMVRNGASSDMALYVIDDGGTVREFEYQDQSRYRDLSDSQKESGRSLPEAMKKDGTSC